MDTSATVTTRLSAVLLTAVAPCREIAVELSSVAKGHIGLSGTYMKYMANLDNA